GLLFSEINNSSSLLSDVVDLSKIPAKWVNKLSPEKNHVTPADFQWKIIASLSKAKQACALQAKDLGYEVKEVPDFLEGEASEAAKNCVLQMRKEPNTLFIWGGETTVHLPKKPGKGGRNQHLALAGAIAMDNKEGMCLLVAGTDGTDGMTTATGALVDGDTVEEGEQLGLNAKNYLAQADSNTFFTQTNELIITGATGTNVMDLVLGIYSPKKI
ncbi:MAG TPA: hydroxypyruvate reductase, partial [Leucothrix sp.]|nr:hydroxypyruvate reductase [Leucothrix sp.]